MSARPQGPVICVDRFGDGVRPDMAEPSRRPCRLESTPSGRSPFSRRTTAWIQRAVARCGRGDLTRSARVDVRRPWPVPAGGSATGQLVSNDLTASNRPRTTSPPPAEQPFDSAVQRRRERHKQRGVPHYWISSSARASTDCGIAMPSARAVLRLTTSSNLAGCSTGRSPGFAPLRIRSM